MKHKKSTKSNLENFSKLFMLLGLVLALLITYIAIEHRTEESADDNVMAYTTNMQDEEEEIPETEQELEEIKREEQKVAPPPVLEEIASDLEGKVKVAKVNVDEEGYLAQQYRISSIPTVLSSGVSSTIVSLGTLVSTVIFTVFPLDLSSLKLS